MFLHYLYYVSFFSASETTTSQHFDIERHEFKIPAKEIGPREDIIPKWEKSQVCFNLMVQQLALSRSFDCCSFIKHHKKSIAGVFLQKS